MPTPPTSHNNIYTHQNHLPRVDQKQDPTIVRPGLGQVAPDIIRTTALGGQRTAVLPAARDGYRNELTAGKSSIF